MPAPQSVTEDAVPRAFRSVYDLTVQSGLSKSEIHRQIAAGTIGVVRYGRRVLIPADAADRFVADLAAGKVTPPQND